MVAHNSTRAQRGQFRHRGIQVDRYFWGLLVKGTREMLVQHGYTQDGLFPGDPGAKKIIERSTDPAGREIKIRRASKYLFVVRREWNEDEKTAFYEAEEKRRAKLNEIETAKKLVESWPKSAGAYREDVRKSMEFSFRMMEILVTDGVAGGYRYDDDTALKFKIIADQLRGLIENGPIVKDLALREQHLPACIANTVRATDAAKQDKTFQRFLAGVGHVGN